MAHDAEEAGGRGGTSAQTPEITPDIVKGEVRDFLRAHEQRRRQLPRAIVIGVLAGLTAVAFTRMLAVGDDLRTRLIERAHGLPPWGFFIPVVLGAFGAGIAVWLVRAVAPEASGSGIPHLEAVLHHMRPMRGAES